MIIRKKDLESLFLGVVIFLYLFLSIVAPHTYYNKIMLIVFVAYSILLMIINKKLAINYYFILYMVFVVFVAIMNSNGYYVDSDIVKSNINTILLNILFLFSLYNILKIKNDISFFKNVFIISMSLSLIVIIFLCRHSLFTARLAHAWGKNAVSYYFLGQPVATSSNIIGFLCDIAFLFCAYDYKQTKNKKYIALMALFLLGLALTGSRKAYIIFAIFGVFAVFNFSKNKQFVINFIKVMIGLIAIYIILMKVPYFYNTIGRRMQSLINYYNSSVIDESSISMRNNLKNYAIMMFKNKPYTGYGLGYFAKLYSNVTENTYLELLVGTGIIGTILYYLYLIPTAISYLKYRKNNMTLKILGIIIISILLTEYGSTIYYERNYIMFVPILIYLIIVQKMKGKCINEN